MKVLTVENVNEAFWRGLDLMHHWGVEETSRAGPVFVVPFPVVTEYRKPWERVLFNEVRDANPFFHLMEALWMLAGREDATWLDQFVSDFSERFSEDGIQHGAYGHRWRKAFGFDQLEHVIKTLRADPSNRQCVIQMWDCTPDHMGSNHGTEWVSYGCNDLLGQWKDRPCNTHIYLRVRQEEKHQQHFAPKELYLDMTVCCRSNDLVWGAYGANAVHFSVLQEYLAAGIGVKIGTYYQLSNNFHVYGDVYKNLQGVRKDDIVYGKDTVATSIVTDFGEFDNDLALFFHAGSGAETEMRGYSNRFFIDVAAPMFWAYKRWRAKDRAGALEIINGLPAPYDWAVAARMWMLRRMKR